MNEEKKGVGFAGLVSMAMELSEQEITGQKPVEAPKPKAEPVRTAVQPRSTPVQQRATPEPVQQKPTPAPAQQKASPAPAQQKPTSAPVQHRTQQRSAPTPVQQRSTPSPVQSTTTPSNSHSTVQTPQPPRRVIPPPSPPPRQEPKRSGFSWTWAIAFFVAIIFFSTMGDSDKEKKSSPSYKTGSTTQTARATSSPTPNQPSNLTYSPRPDYPTNQVANSSSSAGSGMSTYETPKPEPEIKFTKPTQTGIEKVLGVAEIRWCLRNSIYLDSMRNTITSDKGVDWFNARVKDHNEYCSAYRYRRGDYDRAKRDVEEIRSSIMSEGLEKAKEIERNARAKATPTPVPQQQPSVTQQPAPATNQSSSTSYYDKDVVWYVQNELKRQGYAVGTVDGVLGRKTVRAIRQYQANHSLPVTGEIDAALLRRLLES